MASNDWERHKATTLNLYLLERMPLHEVVSYMQQEHDFDKKKSQYEYQFKKWGVKKNLKKKDWQHLRHQLQKGIGKQSEVSLFGFPLSAAKVRKETQRCAAIPTANEFGRRVPSPEVYDGMIVLAQSPSIAEDIMWPPLPWFHFKNIILPTLRHPSNLLKILFASLGSGNNLVQYDRSDAFSLLYMNWRNPSDLRQAILNLSDAIPDDSRYLRQHAQDIEQKELPLLVATEILKLVFFHLSNKIYYEVHLRVHDQFVLHLVEAVSRSNPEMLSIIFSDRCVSTNAIKEEVYGSAIREKNYMMVSRLLDSGVDPHLPIIQLSGSRGVYVKRGIILLQWHPLLSMIAAGMQEAALKCDARLGKMLLDAGVSIRTANFASLFEITASAAGYDSSFEKAMEFAQLLVEHDALASCDGLELISAIGISIVRGNNRLVEFLIEKEQA